MNVFLRAAGICWKAGAVLASTAMHVASPRGVFIPTSFHLPPGTVPTTAMLDHPEQFHRSGMVRPAGFLRRLVSFVLSLPIAALCVVLLAVWTVLAIFGGVVWLAAWVSTRWRRQHRAPAVRCENSESGRAELGGRTWET